MEATLGTSNALLQKFSFCQHRLARYSSGKYILLEKNRFITREDAPTQKTYMKYNNLRSVSANLSLLSRSTFSTHNGMSSKASFVIDIFLAQNDLLSKILRFKINPASPTPPTPHGNSSSFYIMTNKMHSDSQDFFETLSCQTYSVNNQKTTLTAFKYNKLKIDIDQSSLDFKWLLSPLPEQLGP